MKTATTTQMTNNLSNLYG